MTPWMVSYEARKYSVLGECYGCVYEMYQVNRVPRWNCTECTPATHSDEVGQMVYNMAASVVRPMWLYIFIDYIENKCFFREITDFWWDQLCFTIKLNYIELKPHNFKKGKQNTVYSGLLILLFKPSVTVSYWKCTRLKWKIYGDSPSLMR